MFIAVNVKPNSKRPGIKKNKETYVVSVKSPAKEGKANKELIKLLAEHLNIPKSRLSIQKGLKGKNKIIEIL